MESRSDWPLGAALRDTREKAGLSIPLAVERSNGAVSVTRWRQLERGAEKIRGVEVPVKTTRKTVIAAAKAVGLDINQALRLADLPPLDDPADTASAPSAPPRRNRECLSTMSNEEIAADIQALAAELTSRLKTGHSPLSEDPPISGKNAVKAARERRGWSVEDLARRAQAPLEAVRRAEDDPRTVVAGDLLRICQPLGLDPRQLVSRASVEIGERGEIARRKAL